MDKLRRILRTFNEQSLASYAAALPKTFGLPAGNAAQNSYAIKVLWYYDPPSNLIYTVATREIHLPKGLVSDHPFVQVFHSEVQDFIKAAVKEYHPTAQPNPNDPGSRPRPRVVLIDAQVKYIDCLVKKQTDAKLACTRPYDAPPAPPAPKS